MASPLFSLHLALAVQQTSLTNPNQYSSVKMGWKEDWKGVTPMLLFAVLAFAWGDILFGMCVMQPP